MSHDLLRNLLEALQVRAVRVVLGDRNREQEYVRASIVMEQGQEQYEVDARPSDAIAMAMRCDAEIYITDELAAEVLIQKEETEDPEMDAFREFLKKLTPEDVGPSGSGEGRLG